MKLASDERDDSADTEGHVRFRAVPDEAEPEEVKKFVKFAGDQRDDSDGHGAAVPDDAGPEKIKRFV